MRPYKITKDIHDELMQKFSEYLNATPLVGNSFSFSHSITDVKSKDKVFVTFTMKAYIKMRDLVDRYTSEVGWFGFIDKISDLEYQITDICVYPQLVTGATVKETNESWDDDMPIDQIKRRHFHGHSHVNMQPSPSATDIKHRDDQVALVKSDSFYFFMITNKSCAWTAALFDLANNMIYGTDDILIDVDLGDGEMLSDFVDETNKRIKTQTAANLKQMMDERNGVKSTTPAIPTTTNLYANEKSVYNTPRSPWLPKPLSQKETKLKERKSERKSKRHINESLSSQLGLYDYMDDEEIERENKAASSQDYFDDILGHVSDNPSYVNDIILDMSR